MPNIKCAICQKEFYAKPSHIQRGWSKCCSIECRAELQKKGKYVKCAICQKEIWKIPRDIKRSKSGKFFCSKSCQTKWRNIIYSRENHALWKGGTCTYRDIMIESKEITECNKCKEKDIRILVVHHKDQNRKNNSLKNLVWLCRNCHYLVHSHDLKID
jgi:hypothetical protein